MQFCHWDSKQHGILTVSTCNLLTDYGTITEADITKARNTPIEGTHHSCQNELMLYQCIYSSLTDKAKTQLIRQSMMWPKEMILFRSPSKPSTLLLLQPPSLIKKPCSISSESINKSKPHQTGCIISAILRTWLQQQALSPPNS